jgi:glycosyltransferase involved in cell wall biosynthesis
MYPVKEIVFVLNGGIAIQGNKLNIHRSYKQFLAELFEYFDKIIMPQFVVYSSEDSFSDWSLSDISNVIIKDVNIVHSHKSFIHKILNYMAATFKIIDIVRSKRFFYICLPGHVSIIFIISCLFFRKKYALYVRGDWLDGGNSLIEKFYAFLFGNARFILVTGEGYRDRIKPWNKNTEKVIPMIELKREDICHRSSYAFKNRINLLFLSRIEKAKGIFEAIEAFECLLKKNSRIHLTVAGDGPDFVELEALCKAKELIKSVSLLGLIKNKDKLKEIYKSADIFIFPSYREGFPRVLYEAMTFGLPIVTTFVGDVESVMQDGTNCLRVKKRDVADLAEKMWQLICDEKLRQKIGQDATGTVAQLLGKFERSSHAKQVIEWMIRTGI